MRKIYSVFRIFIAALLLGWTPGCVDHVADRDVSGPISLTLLFFNDLHGYLMPFEVEDGGQTVEVGGIARMAALIEDIRKENARKDVRTIVLMAGDVLQGTPMSTVFRGEPDIKCFNDMGVDALTVGNHEFDFGLENFQKLRDLANFPFLSANIVEKDSGELLCAPYITIPLSDTLSFTVIGVTTRELLTTTKAENVAALDVLDPMNAVKSAYDMFKNQGPVVLLSHSRHRTDRNIAEALPGLAAIIGGHDQILLSPYRQVGAVPMFEAFEKGRYLGRVDLSIDPVSKTARLVQSSYIPITDGMPEDPAVTALVEGYHQRLDSAFKEEIGRCETFLDGERERVRYEETNLGNFVADIMALHTGAQIALINSGALRASIKQGPITVEDVFRAVPYTNELMTTTLSGADIEAMLTRSVSAAREDEDGGFLQVSGLSFEVQNRRPINIRIGPEGQPLDAGALYTVVVPDFLSTGGDGYSLLMGKEFINTRLPLRELIVDTIREMKTVSAGKEGRIRRLE